MATSRFCKKCLKSTCEIVFYCTWWLKFCDLYMKYAFSHRSPIKDVFPKFTETHLCRIYFFNEVTGWKPKIVKSSRWRWPVKQDVLKNFADFTGKNLCWSFFLIKLEFWGSVTLLKKTPTQVLSCEIFKLFKKNCFEEHL